MFQKKRWQHSSNDRLSSHMSESLSCPTAKQRLWQTCERVHAQHARGMSVGRLYTQVCAPRVWEAMPIRVSVHIPVHIHVLRTRVCIHVSTCIYAHTCIDTYRCVHAYVSTCIYAHTCMSAYMHAMHACMHVRTYACMYVHTPLYARLCHIPTHFLFCVLTRLHTGIEPATRPRP